MYKLFRINIVINNRNILIANANKTTGQTTKVSSDPNQYAIDDDEQDLLNKPMVLTDDPQEDDRLNAEREAYIDRIRNKSRLLPQHRNMLHNKIPYSEPQSWIHKTVKYNRMQFGRIGLDSGIDPRICFYSKSELADRDEYERVAYPHTIQEMMQINERMKSEQLEAIQKREDDIAKKLTKLEQWKNELNTKIAKKEADARKVKEHKERLVEEVRRHFGFKMDARDERFKELLAQKEKEDKKLQKENKRKLKEEKLMAKLQASSQKPVKTDENSSTIEQTNNS